MRVVVVGAGVLGASTAYHLALAGAEVVIVDSDDQGRATAAGAGIINPWSSLIEDPDWYRLTSIGARYYPHLIESLASHGQTDVSYRKTGAMAVPGSEAELDKAERRVRERVASAPEAGSVTRLAPGDAKALFPALRDDLAALHIEGAARVDGRSLAVSLIKAAIELGARLERGRARLLVQGDHVSGVQTDSETFQADQVVLAAGIWANEILAPLGVRIAIEPQRGQIIHLNLPGVNCGGWPVLLPLNGYYLLAFDDSRIVIGATRETGSGVDYRVTAGGQAEVLNAGLAVAPGLADATIKETRIGFRPMAPSPIPILGRFSSIDGLIIGNGMGHSGLTMGPYVGKLLTQLALAQEVDIDLSPYAPD